MVPGGWGESGDGERFLNNILQKKKKKEKPNKLERALLLSTLA